MPKRTDLRSILILGSGPIRIGQACEFDYSGAQACRVLRREGYRVVLVNSNPATIMTDPEWADATYLEPLDADTVAEIIEREKPDAILPTLGGQTALNLAVELAPLAASKGIELIGADLAAINRAEDRELFRETVTGVGIPVPHSIIATSPDAEFPVPAIVRPAFTLGGRGGGVAHTPERAARRDREGHRREPGRAGARRGVPRGLAGARAGGDVRRARQRRRRLLDREPRPDGRAHRRLVDDRAAADARATSRTSSCARRRSRPRAPSASRPAAPTSSSRCTRRRTSSA